MRSLGKLLFGAAWSIATAMTLTNSVRAQTDDPWLNHGRDSREQRFSPLMQINTANVAKLNLAWSVDLPRETALEATPIEVGGVLYFPGGSGKVYAVRAVDGKRLWTFDPRPAEADAAAAARIYSVNRGVAYWEGKVYTATRDGRMIALDAKTGDVLWATKFILPDTRATSTGAPRVFKGKVIIGNSGAELGARGYVTTMDAASGKVLWRFFTVPGDPAKGFEDEAMATAAKTWSGEWWKRGGGGTPWNGITFDEELNQIYVGTGNGAPWNCHMRSELGKDNLFLSSVVALDPDTGKYKWHYQYNPRECWDWKATPDMVLTDLDLGGQRRKVLMQAPSNGFFYVLDRITGKVISAEKIGKANWAERIDLQTGRPVENPGIRAENGSFTIYPWTNGAHNWHASSYSPVTGLVYIPYMQMGMTFTRSEVMEQMVDAAPGKNRQRFGFEAVPYADPKDPMDGRGSLLAWDPVRQELRWRIDFPTLWQSGTMVTQGGLVFQGSLKGDFNAYDAATGKRLWRFDAKLGIIAPPITYSVDGRQYVSVLVGPGGTVGEGGYPGVWQGWKYGLQPRRLLTFSLDGKARLPATPRPDFSVRPVDEPKVRLDPARVERGNLLYHHTCSACHGAELNGSGGAPDLRESRMALHPSGLRAVLVDGALAEFGMPKGDFSDDEMQDLYQYIRYGTRQALKRRH